MSTPASIRFESLRHPGTETLVHFMHDGHPSMMLRYILENYEAFFQEDAEALKSGWMTLIGPNASPIEVFVGGPSTAEAANQYDPPGTFNYELSAEGRLTIRKAGDSTPADPYCEIENTLPEYQAEGVASISKSLNALSDHGVTVVNPGHDVFLNVRVDTAKSSWDSNEVEFAEFSMCLKAPVYPDTSDNSIILEGCGAALESDCRPEPFCSAGLIQEAPGQMALHATYHFPALDSEALFYSHGMSIEAVNQARSLAIKQELPHIYLDAERGYVSFFSRPLTMEDGDDFNAEFDNHEKAIEDTQVRLAMNGEALRGKQFKLQKDFALHPPMAEFGSSTREWVMSNEPSC